MLEGLLTKVHLEWVITFFAAVGAVYYAAMRIGKMLNTFMTFAREFASMPATVARLSKEIMPNGGSSLADALRNVQHNVEVIDQRQVIIIDASPQVMFRMDTDGRMMFANRAYTKLTGMSSEQLMGDGWVNTIHGAERMDVYEQWRDAVDQQRDFETTYRLVDKHGRTVAVTCKARVMRGDKGRVLGHYGILNLMEREDAT